MNMNFKDKYPVLVLVDLQEGFKDEIHWGGNRNNPGMEKTLAKLLALWRKKQLPVIHVKHQSTSKASPLHKKNPGCKLLAEFKAQDGEPLFKKKVNSAFIGTKLEQFLLENKFETLVFGGLTTNHCISTSVRMAGNLGFKTFVLEDGTATFNRTAADGVSYESDIVHQVSLASLHDEFATVVNSAQVAEMLNDLVENG